MPKRKTHEEYVAELAVKNPGVTVVGEYVSAHTKIDHQCVCGERWDISPSNVLKGILCNDCGNKKTTACTRKSHEEYVVELAAKLPSTQVVGFYEGANKEIEHICGGCGASWFVKPSNLLSGNSKSCKSCGGRKQKNHDEYIGELAKVNPDVSVVGKYINSATAIDHKCGRCGEVWKIRPNCLITGKTKGCQSCSGKKKKTHAEYIEELSSLNNGIKPIDEYKDAFTKIKHLCVCGHEWRATPDNILRGRGCPHCAETATDANVVYLWQNEQGVYKVGITSERCADERITLCARKNGMTANVIMMLKTPNARDIERRALELGDDPRYPDTIDGYTEFRRYSDAELGEVWRMAVGA